MNISLTPELEQMVNAKGASGMYHSASEVIREGLRLLIEQDELKKRRIEALNHEIDKGLASLAVGNTLTDSELMAHIQKRRDDFKNANA